MKKVFGAVLMIVGFFTFSGCAVIDFLDGKHLDQTHDNDRTYYGSGYSGANSGGGHSH